MSIAQPQNGAGKRLKSSPTEDSGGPLIDPVGSLEQNLRDGAAEFDFTALLRGVSPGNRESSSARGAPQKHSFLPRPTPAAPTTVPAHKSFYLTCALISAMTALFVSAGFHLAVSRSGPLPAVMERAASARPLAPAFCLQKGMPDPALTPGEGGRDLIARESVSLNIKRQVFSQYGIELGDSRYVTAYLIPASLGGTNRAANLFPITPWYLTLKKRTDRALTNEVMDGRISGAQARREIATDWLAAMRRRGLRNHGKPVAAPQP